MNLLDHIKNHKLTYGFCTVLVLVVVGSLVYKGPVYDAAGELSGNVRRMFTQEKTLPGKSTVIKNNQKKGENVPKTSQTTNVVENEVVVDNVVGDTRDSSGSNDTVYYAEETNQYSGDDMIDLPANQIDDSMNDSVLGDNMMDNEVPYVTSIITVNEVAAPTVLINGERTLLAFSVTAGDSAEISEMNFEIDVVDNDAQGELSVANYKLYRGSTLVKSIASRPSFTFDSPEVISAGSTQTYTLKADVLGAIETDDSVTAALTTSPYSIVTDSEVLGLPVSHSMID